MTAPVIEGLAFIEHLGTGGYSDVYLYERQSPRMPVAVKVLKEGRISGGELAQFAGEAETMAQLADHPNIVQVFTTGSTGDGRPYLVMKYYPPPNLGVRAGQERFAVAEVLRTGVKIASAVETAHRAGILHRDIKPANILVSQYGEPGLTDFGIAGHGGEEEADDVGVSIPWAAPEVLSGSSNGSPQSDVYSLAATVWHLLVGRSPFEVPAGDNGPRALMGRVLRTPPPATGRADVPQTLDRLLQQGMAKNAAVRPRTALEFARALQSVEQEQRFARTDILVAGLGGGTGERPAPPPSTQQQDRTRMRAPTRVVAQSPPASPFAPGGSSFAPPSAAPRAASMSAPVAEPPTTARPAVARGTQPARAAVAGAGAGEDRTTMRPVTPRETEPESPPPPSRGIKKGYAVLIAAAAVIVAVVVGIVLTSGSSDVPHQNQTLPTPKATDQTIGTAARIAIHSTYDAAAKVVHFTWTVSGAPESVNYLWKMQDDSTQHRTATANADVPSADPAATCIEVAVVNNGNVGGFSAPQCGTS